VQLVTGVPVQLVTPEIEKPLRSSVACAASVIAFVAAVGRRGCW